MWLGGCIQAFRDVGNLCSVQRNLDGARKGHVAKWYVDLVFGTGRFGVKSQLHPSQLCHSGRVSVFRSLFLFFLIFQFYLIYVYEYCICMYVCVPVCLVPLEARIVQWIPWD